MKLNRAIACLVAALSTACASTGHVPRPFPVPTADGRGARTGGEPAPAPSPDPVPAAPEAAALAPPPAVSLLVTALALQGAPYRNGGADPRGFDCSGFTQYVFGRHGIALPRETQAQFAAGEPIGRAEVESGDLVFFSTVAAGATHVAIALDDDQFVHAPSERGVVRIERISLPYWDRRFVGARRVRAALVTR